MHRGLIGIGTETERILGEIWLEILDLDTISADEDFIELGGQSILAARCLSRIRKLFQVDISIRVFFSGSATLKTLGRLIDELRKEGAQSRPDGRAAASLWRAVQPILRRTREED